MQFSNISNILGGRDVLRGDITSRMDLIDLSNRGITKDALLRLADYLSLSASQIAQLLSVTERTIKRYSRQQRFNRVVSEQILQIAEVVARGVEIFGDKEKFLSWMKTPNFTLNNLARPLAATKPILDCRLR
ncbi:MAG: hypothetical protein QME81_02025, partial [bacterium]|nr:hypothetical protein [bacterium]